MSDENRELCRLCEKEMPDFEEVELDLASKARDGLPRTLEDAEIDVTHLLGYCSRGCRDYAAAFMVAP